MPHSLKSRFANFRAGPKWSLGHGTTALNCTSPEAVLKNPRQPARRTSSSMRRLTVPEPSDFGLFNGRRGGPRDAEPAKRRRTKQSLSFRRARQQLREENVYLPVVASAWIPRRVRSCAGFRTPAVTSPAHVRAAGVGKAPRHEIAGSGGTGGAAGSMGI